MLGSHYRRFWNNTSKLNRQFHRSNTALSNGSIDTEAHLLACEMCVIRLHDFWSYFCRHLVIYSASGKATTSTGFHIPAAPGINGIPNVIPVLMSSYRRRRNEPSWYLAFDCLDAAQRLNIGNLSKMMVAIGSSASPADEIRLTRNFLAHRGNETARQIHNYYGAGTLRSLRIQDIAGVIVSAGSTRFENWVSDFRLIAEMAVQ